MALTEADCYVNVRKGKLNYGFDFGSSVKIPFKTEAGAEEEVTGTVTCSDLARDVEEDEYPFHYDWKVTVNGNSAAANAVKKSVSENLGVLRDLVDKTFVDAVLNRAKEASSGTPPGVKGEKK